jgi:hypothetical protein
MLFFLDFVHTIVAWVQKQANSNNDDLIFPQMPKLHGSQRANVLFGGPLE